MDKKYSKEIFINKGAILKSTKKSSNYDNN